MYFCLASFYKNGGFTAYPAIIILQQLRMSSGNYGFIWLLILLGGCSSGNDNWSTGESAGTMSGYLSIPEVIPAGQPVIIRPNADSIRMVPAKGKMLTAVQRTVQPAANNTHPAGQPLTVAIPDILPVFTPGENGVPRPRTIAAAGNPLSIQNPELTRALPPDFRDNAQFNIQVLEVEQGLTSSSFQSIQEDPRGHLWLGSANGGLTRYDGHYFAHFTTRQGLPSDRIFSMRQDQQGRLWFGMDDYAGLICYDGKTFIHFGPEQGIPTRVIYDILQDREGDFWFATEGEGVIRYDGQQFTFFTKREGLSSNDVFSIEEDQHGNLWFGTESGGVTKYDGKRFTHYLEIGDNTDVVATITEDSKGVLWFGTVRNGIYRYDGKLLQQYTTDQGLNNNCVLDILEDDHSQLWLATRGGGVNRFDGRRFTYFSTGQGVSSNTILTLGEDHWGNIWFGTEGGGVCKFTPGSFQYITQNEGLRANPVRTITEDRNGSYWLGNQRGDISNYDGRQFEHFNLEAIGSSWIISSLEDQQGQLWFGTFGSGLIRYDPANGQFTQFSEAEGLSWKSVERILEDSEGNIWAGTFEGGVNKFDGRNFTYFSKKDGLAGNSVISLLQDRNGDMWFGTFRNGICRYDGNSFTTYTTAQGLSHNGVRVIFEDSRGYLWFGTEGGGLNRYDGKNFVRYQLKEGLGDNHIHSIQEDEYGNFWFGTMDGLYYASYADEQADGSDAPTFHLTEYGRTDGLKTEDFLSNSWLLDRSKRLWWGTEKGIVLLDLEGRSMSTEPPKVYLNQIDLNQQFIDFSDKEELEQIDIPFSETVPFYGYPTQLNLPYMLNSLTFHFSAMNASQAYKTAFQYRLHNYDQHWSEPTGESYVDYRNLPAGRYQFELRAIGESGSWSEPISYSFYIRPPWWLSWWAKLLYSLLAAVALLAVGRFERKRRYKKQLAAIERARLEEKSKQAEKIADQARELARSLEELKEKNALITAARDQLIVQEKLASLGNLTAGISHEIKNPLNFITNFAEDSGELTTEISQLISGAKEHLPPKVYSELLELLTDLKNNATLIEKNGLKIDRIVRSMMDHARGKNTGWEYVDVNQLLDENIHLAYHSYRATNFAFNVEIQKEYDHTLPRVRAHQLQLGRVFLNIITNACYAINEKQKRQKNDYEGLIQVSTQQVNGAVEVRIRDNGVGIPSEVRKEIFTPFFTTKPTGQGNTGLGLSISYDIIVKEHHGQLEVESEAGLFTEFRIVLQQEQKLGSET